jgi:hypothetical protein
MNCRYFIAFVALHSTWYVSFQRVLVSVEVMSSWGEQFSTGDQGVDRITFWEKDFKICPKCNWTGKFTNTTHCAGCRMNGDGYGTEVFKCEGCGWQTSFLYDESGMIVGRAQPNVLIVQAPSFVLCILLNSYFTNNI